MKKHTTLTVFFICTLIFHHGYAQNWARNGYIPSMMSAGCQANASTLDASGNSYVFGFFYGPYISFGTDTLFSDPAVGNMSIVKYDRSGNVIWARKTIGGGQPTCMVADRQRNIYITGQYITDSIVIGTYTLHKIDSGYNFFLAKLDSTGNVLWARSGDIGASCAVTYDHSNLAVTLDTFNHVYLSSGYSRSNITLGSHTLTNARWGKLDIMLAKYDVWGNLYWLKGAAGNDDDYINSETTDNFGNIYTGGWFRSDSLQYGGGTTLVKPTGTDLNGFITKYDSSGNVVWAKLLPGLQNQVTTMNTGPGGSLYCTGVFGTWASLDTTTLYSVCTQNGYIAKLDPAGTVQWVKQIKNGFALSSAIDPVSKHIWMCGRFGYSGGFSGCYPYLTIGADTIFCPVASPGTTLPNFIAEVDTMGNVLYKNAYSSGGYISNISVDSWGDLLYTGSYLGDTTFTIADDTLPAIPPLMFIEQQYMFAARIRPYPMVTTRGSNYLNEQEIVIYPNPSSARFSVVYTGLVDNNATITLYNAAGALVSVSELRGRATEIRTESLPPGTYICRITANGTSVFKKIIIY